jgi:hypothetical protein
VFAEPATPAPEPVWHVTGEPVELPPPEPSLEAEPATPELVESTPLVELVESEVQAVRVASSGWQRLDWKMFAQLAPDKQVRMVRPALAHVSPLPL